MNRGPQPFRVEAGNLGQELPRPRQRIPLEVVADRKVAEHEEEGAVALVANLVDIDGAEALLYRGHPRSRRCLQAQEVGRHLLHAGRRQQDGSIADGHEG